MCSSHSPPYAIFPPDNLVAVVSLRRHLPLFSQHHQSERSLARVLFIMLPEAVPSSSTNRRTSSTADSPNHQASANKRSATEATTSELEAPKLVYIILEIRTRDIDGTDIHSVYSSLTDANNAVIGIGESGSLDIGSDNFEVQNENSCISFTAPDSEDDDTAFKL
jgi:hypothetical protein